MRFAYLDSVQLVCVLGGLSFLPVERKRRSDFKWCQVIWPELESIMYRANYLVPNAAFPIAYGQVWYTLLNDCWKAYYAKHQFTPGEALLLDRQADAHVRKVASVVFGHPQLAWSDNFVVMKKRLLSEREVAFRLEPGRSVGWLSEIRDNGYDGSQVLTIKADTLGSSVAYRVDGSVRLGWGVEPDFSFTGEDTLRLKLKRGYQTKRGVDLYSFEQPIKNTLRELSVFFQPYNQGTAMAFQYFTPGLLAGQEPGPLPSSETVLVDNVVVFLFSEQAFPEVKQGKAPEDETWLPTLVFPPPRLRRKDGSYESSLGAYGTEYHSPREQFSQGEGVRPQKLALTLDPLVRVVTNGEDKQAVLLVPGPDTAAWVLEGERLGRLEREGSTRYYYPPAGPGSGAVLSTENKTGRPAAVISSVPKWFTVDMVKATQNGESAYSTFAAYHAPQTHYLKASLENGKFKLELWYYDVEARKDLPVPEGDTEWGVVSGNGTLSPSGVFNPAASNPSSFSVVWARDTSDPRLLLWAFTVIPMPLYSPEEAVALYNG
ncbi:hypothetical protein D0O09_05105 [Pseudomonas putida]|nr:hypothetical protein D0O09_05105 [Pseudomonas putida]